VLSIEDVQDRKLIVLWVPGGQTRPYKVPASVTAKNKTWHYYIRRYASTVEAKGEDELELLSLAAKVPFDDRFCQAARIADLSQPLMQDFLREVRSELAPEAPALPVETLGRQMNVVGGADEAPLPKNVGLLFFNEAPERFFPGTQIDVLWFPESAGGDRFPYAALEEALVNAVYHRSYEEREPIEVRISPDELVVLSFPGPDGSIKLADLQAGRAVSRRYRNRRVGEFLKELELTEGRATGIPKILKVMAANRSPPPMFETDDERISFVVRLPVHEGARTTSTVVTDQVTDQVTDAVLSLLAAAAGGEHTRRALQDALGLKHAPHFREAYLLPAIAAGLLEMTLPDQPTSRMQRYRPTPLGRSVLAALGIHP
jgi:ATP-dependent DNA helicase RecG